MVRIVFGLVALCACASSGPTPHEYLDTLERLDRERAAVIQPFCSDLSLVCQADKIRLVALWDHARRAGHCEIDPEDPQRLTCWMERCEQVGDHWRCGAASLSR